MSDNDEVFDPNKVQNAPKSGKKTADKPAKKNAKPAAESQTVSPLKIETDIPLPENNAGRKSSFNGERMPFGQLEVGQSFAEVLTDGKTADGITVKTVMSQVKKAFPDRSFVVRQTDDFGIVTARFWRKK